MPCNFSLKDYSKSEKANTVCKRLIAQEIASRLAKTDYDGEYFSTFAMNYYEGDNCF